MIPKPRLWKLLLPGLLVLTALYFYGLGQQSVQPIAPGTSGLDFSVAEETWRHVKKSFLHADSIDQKTLKYGFAKGLVNTLSDQHSSFFTPEEAKIFLSSLQGNLEGIGAELKLVDGAVMVVSPLPGSPAFKAGILPKDIILKINGEVLETVTDLNAVVMKIRGPKETSVKLHVLHENALEASEITVVRDTIHVEAVSWLEKDYQGKKFAVMKLNSFSDIIGSEFEKVLGEIQKKGYHDMVLDLRFNGGGYLEGAVDVLSYFLPENSVAVRIRERDHTEDKSTLKKPIRFSGKLVVLVNDSSASAAEIVAGALKDYGLASLVGVTTFGKGTVQEVQPLSDGSMLRITVAEWLTPKNNSIEGKGIIPDTSVALDFNAFRAGKDNQLDAALSALYNR